MRIFLDANVLFSAAHTPSGVPGQIVAEWLAGGFELVVSPRLLEEVDRALRSPRYRGDRESPLAFVSQLRELAVLVEDPAEVESVVLADPADDFLVALARTAQASVIVTGDRHLLEITGLEPPAIRPREFLAILRRHLG